MVKGLRIDWGVAGNEAIKSKDYTEAEAFYTEAISVAPQGPNTHIYYCNRAAARSFLEDFAAGGWTDRCLTAGRGRGQRGVLTRRLCPTSKMGTGESLSLSHHSALKGGLTVSFFPCDGDEQLWTTARRPSSSIPATSSELLTETYSTQYRRGYMAFCICIPPRLHFRVWH